MKLQTPYHSGELEMQKRTGELETGTRNGAVINDEVLKGALKFIKQQSYCLVTSQDENQDIWTSFIFGDPEFADPGANNVVFDREKIKSPSEDIFWRNISNDKKVGSLFIELESRRRMRINGDWIENNLHVKESYPNCPKYIQRRIFAFKPSSDPVVIKDADQLNEDQLDLIKKSDSFFVGSGHPDRGLDASHRGGNPGFITLTNEGNLLIPDYVGNSMYNTLGNIYVNPKVGLLFIDFENNRTLQLSGIGKVLFDHQLDVDLTDGTNRYWQFEVKKMIETQLGVSIDWEFLDYSPFNPKN